MRQSQFTIVYFLTLFFISVICGKGYAQSKTKRDELEQKKKENLIQIAEIKGILDKTLNKKEVNLGQLKAINKQVEVKEKQIDLLSQDLSTLNEELKELIKMNQELTVDFDKLKKEYGQMINNSAKTNKNLSTLSFLFSAKNFNQMVLRFNYLKQVSKVRKKQALEIDKLRLELTSKQEAIINKKSNQKQILNSKVSESKTLDNIKSKQLQVVNKLIQKEGDLRKQITERTKAVKQLENLISNTIEKEIKRTRAKAEKSKADKIEKSKNDEEEVTIKEEKNTNTIKLNASGTTLSNSFSASKGRLPWPVGSGFISEGFGSHPHQVLRGITVPNDGIEIQTNSGENVRSVYDGIVMVVDNNIIGMGSVVAIQHGDYFTIYGKLRNVTVSAGQRVHTKETIGTVMEGKDGTSEVQFQVWKNTQRQNPEKWLLNR